MSAPTSLPGSPVRGSGRPELTRRGFLGAGVAALLSPYLLGCDLGLGPEEVDPGDPRLSARPGTPSIEPTLGETRLGFTSGRDGMLYVPESYDPAVPAPLFVALHGAGGEGANWVGFEQASDNRGMILLAPDSRSSTWDRIRGGFGPDVHFIDEALEHTFDRCNVDPNRIALGGFSDGASYALSLGVSNGDLFTHLVAFSPGFIAAVDPLVGKPRIYVSHGVRDGVLSFANTRDNLVPRLEGQGYDVTFQEFGGAHEVPPGVGTAALNWFLEAEAA